MLQPSALTLLRLRSSTKHVNLLFPLGTKVLACFHSRHDDISLHRLLEVVNLLQNTVKLNTSPISPPCCFRRWRNIDVLPQPASPTSKTGLPPSLNKPTRWEMRCWQKGIQCYCVWDNSTVVNQTARTHFFCLIIQSFHTHTTIIIALL